MNPTPTPRPHHPCHVCLGRGSYRAFDRIYRCPTCEGSGVGLIDMRPRLLKGGQGRDEIALENSAGAIALLAVICAAAWVGIYLWLSS